MLLDDLSKKGLITPPPFVLSNTHYLAVTGSHAYGVADTSVKSRMPDYDCYGFCLPPRDYLFPHLRGIVRGFGDQGPNFDQYMQHHIIDQDALGGNGQEYDLTIFNVIKFFELCRQGNPNMLDVLYVPENCIKICTTIGRMVRDNRKLFLSKLIWPRFRGYAWEQMHKMDSKDIQAKEQLNHILKFEEKHNLDRKTNLATIEAEIKKRGLTSEVK